MSDVCKLTAYWSSLTDRREYSRRAAHLHLGDRRGRVSRAGWQWGSLLSTAQSPLVLGEGSASPQEGVWGPNAWSPVTLMPHLGAPSVLVKW